jgi:PKD repeat protein
MPFTNVRRAAIALALIATAGCTVKDTQAPPLTGPSGLALTLTLNAIPDSISQDGGSQSSVKVTAIGPDGKPISALPLRVDMMVDKVATDFGSLSARSIVTNSDGVASVVYTAPPASPNGTFTQCPGSNLPGSCVTIVATATATNFVTASPQSVLIRLVPTGVILPPASTPTASFQFSPVTVGPNQNITFDATASCGGSVSAGTCSSSSPLTYSWNFGDGSSGTGAITTHSYSNVASYAVTLTVTNDRGVSASATKPVAISASGPPKDPSINVSPATIHVNSQVFFNTTGSTASPGRTIQSYDWDFGDGTAHGSGTSTTHQYATANTFTVTLTVTDDLGQQSFGKATVPVLP